MPGATPKTGINMVNNGFIQAAACQHLAACLAKYFSMLVSMVMLELCMYDGER